MEKLLARSEAFEESLAGLFGEDLVLADDRVKFSSCANACLLSNEHASILRLAFMHGAANSAAALLRLQYEALLRGAWILHAASDEQIALLAAPLDKETETLANKLPSAEDMRKGVAGSAPAGLAKPLTKFREANWKSLNSFVHGGIHPLQRIEQGFPIALAENVVRSSNGLLHMSYRLLASLSGSETLMARVTSEYRAFADCLPPLTEPSGVHRGQ